MRRILRFPLSTLALASALIVASCNSTVTAGSVLDPELEARPEPESTPAPTTATNMQLGAFSVSLAVQDLTASRAFYEKLGFEQIGGVAEQNWLVLKNDAAVIGLFQGMFENNILTFNPGWGGSGQNLEGEFTDIRDLQTTLQERGITPVTPITDEAAAAMGPASFVLMDPDGNPVLVDQHR